MARVPTGRFRRLTRMAGLAPQLGSSLLLGEGRRRAVAAHVLHTLGELKGGSMKMGQILAQVSDALPPDFRMRLDGLFSEAPTLPWEEIEPQLLAGIGDPDLIEAIEHEPFAGASLGQVHRARLRDGRTVAVKIQYPQVALALDQDIENLQALARVGTGGGWVFDIAAQLSSVRESLEAELDYTHELRELLAMQALLAPWADLVVPGAVPSLCSATVFTTEFLEGPTLHHAGQGVAVADREQLAHQLTRAVLLPILLGHRLNADAHPGNFVLLTGPALGLLDFGAVREVPAHAVQAFRGLLSAWLDDPRADILPLLQQMGMPLVATSARDRRAADTVRDTIGPCFTQRHDFSTDDTLAVLARYKQHHPLDLLHFVPSPSVLHLWRALMGLLYGLKLLGVTVDLSPTVRDVAAAR